MKSTSELYTRLYELDAEIENGSDALTTRILGERRVEVLRMERDAIWRQIQRREEEAEDVR